MRLPPPLRKQVLTKNGGQDDETKQIENKWPANLDN
jgi:hypothetical protein